MHHPDPYQKGDVTVEEVRRELASYNLDGWMDGNAVQQALAHPQGLPIPVIGSRTKVLLNGQPIKFAVAPIRVGNDWLVPVGPLAAALQAQLEISDDGSFAILVRGGTRLLLSRDSSDAVVNGYLFQVTLPMRSFLGYPMVPLRSIATALGATVGWEEATQSVLLSNNPVLAPLNSASR